MVDHAAAPLARLLGPADAEVTCEVCFEELDRYVELELAGADARGGVPGMAEHLKGCPACAEEYDSLKALLTDAGGAGPAS
jgi:hypothetical protein